MHFGGYCLKYSSNDNPEGWQFRLKATCELFEIVTRGCIRHLLTQKFLETVGHDGGYYMIQTDTCRDNSKATGFERMNYSVIFKRDLSMFLAPYKREPFVDGIHGVFLYPHKTTPARVFEFYFPQGKQPLV